MNRFLLLSLLAFTLAACQTETEPAADSPARSTADVEADRQAVEEIDRAYQQALQAGDPAAIVALHADDAVVLPPDGPALRGRSAIEAEYAERYTEGQDVTLTTEEVVVAESGDLAYIVGSSSDPDGPGKYLTVLQRDGDGWKIVADAWNTDAPPPTGTAGN